MCLVKLPEAVEHLIFGDLEISNVSGPELW